MEIFGMKLFEKPAPESDVSYVFRGATLECNKGSTPSRLDMPCSHGVYREEKPQVNILDFKPKVNIMPFGSCSIKGGPCVPETAPWVDGKDDVLVEEQPALLSKSTTSCAVGGKIRIVEDGQE
ncbi:MAG: DUF4280 domain-containing protein [Pelosinus sp.]|nr:DUF4280 domain-containing protein [Pelosinus sp.]